MPQGIIYDIMRYALHDGPGIRTTVFFKGCPLSCQWCANPESQNRNSEFMFFADKCLGCNACMDACEKGAILVSADGFKGINPNLCNGCGECVAQCYAEALQLAGSAMSADEVVARVMKDRDFFRQSGGGVTFSGGEPLSRPAFLRACLEKCRQNRLHTCVETTGFAPWEVLDGILADVDLFLYDLKTADPKVHEAFTGVSNELILDNLKKLAARHNLIIRMPMIPGINDRGTPWKKTVEFLKELPWRGAVELLPYHRMGMGKYGALNRLYGLDPELKADEHVIRLRNEELDKMGFQVAL